MSLDKNELRYLINELKKHFIVRSDIGDLTGVVTEEDLKPLIDDVELIKNVIEEPPTYIMPTASINVSPINIVINKETEIKLSIVFNRNDAGNVNNMILRRNGIVISEDVIINEFNDIVTISDTDPINYSLTIIYDEGDIKNSNLGNPYPENAIKAGELTIEKSVPVIAPCYYGSVDLFDMSLLKMINNTSKEYTFNSIYLNNEKFVYMYPSSFGEVNSIKDGNGFEYIDSYTKEHIMYNGIDYLVYILTDAVTISDFKQVFS